MFRRAVSAVFLSFVALLIAPLCAAAAIAETAPAESNLTNPFYIAPRAGQRHIALDSDWELPYRDSAIASPADLSTAIKVDPRASAGLGAGVAISRRRTPQSVCSNECEEVCMGPR